MSQKRFLALLLAGVMTMSLALSACGAIDDEADPTPSTEPTAQVTDDPAEETQPGQDADGAETDAPDGETADPDASDTAGTTAPAVGDKAADVIKAVWSDVEDLDLPAFMEMDDEVLNSFYGIDVSDLEEYVGKIPMMNVQATEFFIAKVKSGKMDTVKKAVEGRVEDLVDQWSQYLPEQLELVEDARVVVNGDYILLAISEYADDAVKAFNGHTK